MLARGCKEGSCLKEQNEHYCRQLWRGIRDITIGLFYRSECFGAGADKKVVSSSEPDTDNQFKI